MTGQMISIAKLISNCINDLRGNSEIDKAEEVEIHDLKILFNNLDGFKSKRVNILNSELIKNYDILVFQETMVRKFNATKYDDFSIVDKIAKITHFTKIFRDCSYFSQGSMFVWDPAKVKGSLVSLPSTDSFEISAMKFSSKFDSITIISAYRSPSMKEIDGNVSEFFISLIDAIASIEGRIFVVGDLNIERGRKIVHKKDEVEYIKMIERTGLKSMVRGTTHYGLNRDNQLDYAFTNSAEAEAKIIDGFGSDHRAISINLKLNLPIFYIPAKSVSYFTRADESLMLQQVEELVDILVSQDIGIEDSLIELDILLWEIKEFLVSQRMIPGHYRVSGCSRQVSNSILNEEVDDESRRENILEDLRRDAARKLKKNLTKVKTGQKLWRPLVLERKIKNC